MDYEYFIDTMDATPLVVEPDNHKKVIVGVSVKQEGIDFIGQHSFIMFIDENSPKKSIMLDASGHYGEGRHRRGREGEGCRPQAGRGHDDRERPLP